MPTILWASGTKGEIKSDFTQQVNEQNCVSAEDESVTMGHNNPPHFASFPHLYQKFHFIRIFTNIMLINGGYYL